MSIRKNRRPDNPFNSPIGDDVFETIRKADDATIWAMVCVFAAGQKSTPEEFMAALPAIAGNPKKALLMFCGDDDTFEEYEVSSGPRRN